jgi:hypothetical protein
MATKKYYVAGDHWVWTGATTAGNPCVKHQGRKVMVRRLHWEQKNGPVPDGCRLHLTCDQRNCVNPDHLRVGHRGRIKKPRLTHAERRERRIEIYMLKGCEKGAVIAAMYGISPDHVSRIHTLGRTHQL